MLQVKIDFDEASKEWRKNKKSIGNGYFCYTCNYIKSNNNKCNKIIVSNIINNKYICDFGGTLNDDKIKYHPNKDIRCKRHLNRINLTNPS